MVTNKDLWTLPRGIPGPCPGAKLGEGIRRRAPGGPAPLSMGSGWAQPEKQTLVRPHVDPPSTRGAIEAQCYVDWVVVKGTLAIAEAGYQNMECYLSDGEGL